MILDPNQSSSWPLSRMNSSEPNVAASRPKAEEVQLDAFPLRLPHLLLHPGRVFHDARGQEQAQQTHRHVQKEDPAPVEVVRDVAAQRRPDGRRTHHGQAIHRERLPALLRREGVGQDRLLARRQASAPCALQYPEKHQQRQRGRQPAQRRRDTEQRHADHVELLAPDERGHVRARRQDHGVGHQVAGQHPGRFVLRRAQATRNVRQAHVRDRAVQHLHERRQRHRHRDDPRIDLRTPRCRHGNRRALGNVGKGSCGCHVVSLLILRNPCRIREKRHSAKTVMFRSASTLKPNTALLLNYPYLSPHPHF